MEPRTHSRDFTAPAGAAKLAVNVHRRRPDGRLVRARTPERTAHATFIERGYRFGISTPPAEGGVHRGVRR
jgi:hypothetical protein